MENQYTLLGVCGLYCGACYHYRAAWPQGQHLLSAAVQQGRSPEEFTCQGCRSERLYMQPGCAQCQLRACAEARNILHCGLCQEFPCAQLRAFQADGRVHHVDVYVNLREITRKGPDQWLAEQARRWTCVCGAPFSWYEVRCPHCGRALSSYGPDPRFPDPNQ
jgi:hypothetical protein